MKILYVANERRAAQLAAAALHGIAPDVKVTWAGTLPPAMRWLQDNSDVAALIVDAEVRGQSCVAFLDHVRGLGLAAPVVVVAPDPRRTPADLKADYIVRDQTLTADLPAVLRRALQQAPAASAAAVLPTPASPLPQEADKPHADQLPERRPVVLAFGGPTAATRHAEIESRLADETARRRALEQDLATAEAAFRHAKERHAAEAAAAAERLAETQAQHQAAAVRAGRICQALEQRALELEAALRQAEQQRASEVASSADLLARRHAEFTTGLTQAAQTRDTLAQQLSAAMAALDEARRLRATEAAAAAERLARREAELGARLAETAATRDELQRALAEADRTLHEAEQRAAAERATLDRASAERELELERRLGRELDARTSVEQELGDARVALERSRQARASDSAAAAEHLARREAELGAALAESEAARAALERTYAEAGAAHVEARQRAAADLAAAAARETTLEERLAHEEAARAALERTYAHAEAAHLEARQRAVADLAAAAARQTALEDGLARESAERTALERDLAGAREASARTRRRILNVAAALRQRTRDHKARFESQLERERADHERSLRARADEIRERQTERDALQRSVASMQQQLQQVQSALDDERQQFERARTASDSELQRLGADYDQARQSLDQVRSAFATLEQASSEHAAERTRLEQLLVERDAQLSAQVARQLAAEQAASAALARVQEQLDGALDMRRRETAQLQGEMEMLRQELGAARTRVEALSREAERVPALLKQLEDGQKETRRQYDRAPWGMCRCDSAGAIVHANRAVVRLLGYRNLEDLRNADFGRAVFESPTDLRWLLERAVKTGATEWVETSWRRKDRRRLVVRLQLQAAPDGSVDMVVEDVTRLRAVEEKLRQAQRIEAVGRVASEVAETCQNLLRDVSQDARQMLSTIGGDPALQQRGELLLGEVTRAAGFLRQLAAYGGRQVASLEPVNVQRVLRDLAPVLKRVVGDDIELVLPKTTAAFDVDVDPERVERVLVNVARYARERMPQGGRVRIDLATAVADSRFVAKHPSVRRGAHVLITVTGVGRVVRAGQAVEWRPDAGSPDARKGADDKPGVDLGALLALIGDCGGHLWMAAEPAGNMTLKIQLPKRAADEPMEPVAPVPPAQPGRSLVKWFRH
jgi:hypothetical protein